MSPSPLSDVLVTLAQAQRLSERLPPRSADLEAVAIVIATMKALHREVTGVNGRAILVINHTRASVEHARAAIARIERGQRGWTGFALDDPRMSSESR
jgi:hypothetical protein